MTVQGIEKDFENAIHILSRRHGLHTLWSDFVLMTACAISNAVDTGHYVAREKMYLNASEKYTKEELETMAQMIALTALALRLRSDQDFLGTMFMKLQLANKHIGQTFTPYHIAKLMADITCADIRMKSHAGPITVCDPCCGAGVMLIAAVNLALEQGLNPQDDILLFAQDIDMTAALMCYIQLSLLDCCACVVVGNSLTRPMLGNGMPDDAWLTPACFSTELQPQPTGQTTTDLAETEKETII